VLALGKNAAFSNFSASTKGRDRCTAEKKVNKFSVL